MIKQDWYKLVAAKAWAALFAAGDLARKVEQGERTAPPSQPQPTWREVLKQLLDTERTKALIDGWQPRGIKPGVDVPATGKPEHYGEGTPERTLAVFLCAWQKRNYGSMARCLLNVEDKHQINKLAGELRASYESKPLYSFELLELRDEAAAVTVIRTKLNYGRDGNTDESIRDFRLINEDAVGNATIRGKPGSRWTLYTPYV